MLQKSDLTITKVNFYFINRFYINIQKHSFSRFNSRLQVSYMTSFKWNSLHKDEIFSETLPTSKQQSRVTYMLYFNSIYNFNTCFTASLPSLAAGLTFGGLAAVGAYHTTQNPADVKVSLGKQVVLLSIC